MREFVCLVIIAGAPILIGVLLHEGYYYPAIGTAVSWIIFSVCLKW